MATEVPAAVQDLSCKSRQQWLDSHLCAKVRPWAPVAGDHPSFWKPLNVIPVQNKETDGWIGMPQSPEIVLRNGHSKSKSIAEQSMPAIVRWDAADKQRPRSFGSACHN